MQYDIEVNVEKCLSKLNLLNENFNSKLKGFILKIACFVRNTTYFYSPDDVLMEQNLLRVFFKL